MGLYNLTLDELVTATPTPVIDPGLPIAGLEGLTERIYDEFGQREIGFETPGLFIRKLNNKLKILAPNYNRMLAAQFIEFDPFVTDYIEDFNRADSDKHFKEHEGYKEVSSYAGDTTRNSQIEGTESYQQSITQDTEEAEVGKKLTGKLASESINESHDKETTSTTDKTINETYEENTKVDTTGHEEGSSDRTWTEDSDRTYSETEDFDGTGSQNDTTTETSTDNQTGREWTENGNNQGHVLDVRSDTPQAMLFNEPNHYYGTGRAHDYGEVYDKADGGQGYAHYPEAEPDTFDTGSYDIGGGDTPWFNYASEATNHTEHSSYDKSGTETYSRDGSKNGSLARETTDTHNKETEGTDTTNKEGTDNTDTTKDTTSNETGTKDHTQENIEKVTATGTETALDSSARNTHEAGSEDNTNSRQQAVVGSDKKDTQTTNSSNSFTSDKHQTNKGSGRRTKNQEHVGSTSSSVRKGRVMRSPSDLITEYRRTLTFSADLWLFTELDELFLNVF